MSGWTECVRCLAGPRLRCNDHRYDCNHEGPHNDPDVCEECNCDVCTDAHSRRLYPGACGYCGGPFYIEGAKDGPAVLVVRAEDGMRVQDVEWDIYHSDCSHAPYSTPIDLDQIDTVAQVNDLIRRELNGGAR